MADERPPEAERILALVRETAKANDGKPLGRSRFEAATGVRESDWAGRYWVRWSDVVREAGYAPNTMNESLPDGDVLEPLADLVADLGRWPTVRDLRMAARERDDFPSHNTFDRWGGKEGRAQALVDYCRDRDDLRDVAAIAAAEIPKPDDEPDAPSDVPMGFVYLVRSGRYFKIGHTNDMGRREYELRLQLPQELRVVHVLETDDPAGIEAYWHRRFADRRANGEWFELTRDDVRAFRSRGASM